MPWMLPAAIGGSAAVNLITAGSAGDKQSAASDKAIAATANQNAIARNDLAPYRDAGQAALTRLRSMLGLSDGVDESDPRYKAILNPMIAELDRQHQERFGMSTFDPRADAAATQQHVDAATKAAKDQYLQQYGSQGGTNPDDSPLLRKFSQSDLTADPVYQNGLQFGLDEGTKALERRASSTGGYDSGGTLKALTRYANDYGSTKAADAYGRFTSDQDRTYGKLSGIAGMGSGATNVGVNAGANTAGNLSNLYTGAGNSAGAAAIAQGNAISGGVNGYMNYNLLSQLSGGGQRQLQGYNPGASDLYSGNLA